MDTIEKAMQKLADDPPSVDKNSLGEEAPAVSDTPLSDDVLSNIVEGEGKRAANRITLDLEGLAAGGIVDADSDRRDQLAEEFRIIKQPILAHAKGRAASRVEHPNLVMVTSSLAGEGKTFTAINLALSIAMEKDHTVLLVDADVAKPEVTRRLNIEAEAGLTDVLLDESLDLGEVLIKTHLPHLSVLPAGRRHAQATELLASDAMKRLADEMAMRYPDRIIIFDSPPLLPTTEARVLAGLMGQVLLVVEQGKTQQPVVLEALEMLESQEIVGLVLNKVHKSVGGGYGYGRGYGYGYGHG